MNAIKATIRNGRLEVDVPADWPEGGEVTIPPPEHLKQPFGLDESEWRDDAEALADWAVWLKTIEPFEFTPGELAERSAFDEKMRQFNLEAVRVQMQQGSSS